MDVVVTGASGFLGRAVLRRLRADGATVHALSRGTPSGAMPGSDYANAPAADALVHLAGIANRQQAEAAGPAYEQAAATALATLLAKGYGRVVYASSAVLYGDQHEQPCDTATALTISDRYSRIKRAAEQAVLSRGGSVARLANVYGPGMAGGTVLDTILGQIPGSGPLQVMDDEPVRDFVWVDDAAAALALLAAGGSTGVFNVGSGTGTSVRELARTALELAGEEQRPVLASAPRRRRSHLVLDIASTCAALPWRPAVPLRAGLTRLMDARQRMRVTESE